MVYENTHLWAAREIRGRIENRIIGDIIAANLDHYHLGAIFPDAPSFNKDQRIRDSGSFLHGATGIPTNAFVLDILDHIRGMQDEKNLAFVCGFLTHCAMDIVFHPVVFYFSGYEPNNDKTQQLQSLYLHWHYETIIDRHFNKKVFLEKLVKPIVVQDLSIPAFLNISKHDIIESLKKQVAYFRRIHSRLYYLAYRMLAGIGLIDKKWVAGFYANLNVEKRNLPEKLNYRDIITGEDREATLDCLMESGITMAVEMIEAAYDYYVGNISKETFEGAVVGNNLDTGRFNKTKDAIRFSMRS